MLSGVGAFVVARTSVTRELGSPVAPLLDSASRASRRSSSRASRRTTREPEAIASNLSQSSYSLPPTPLTSTFEESIPSAKRRRTQRNVDHEDQALPTDAPDQKDVSDSLHPTNGDTSKATRSQSSVQPNEGDAKEVNAQDNSQTATPSTTKPNNTSMAHSDQSQPTLHSFLLKHSQVKRHSPLSEQPEPEPETQPRPIESTADNTSTNATMDNTTTAGLRSRQTRKSTPAKLNISATQEPTSTTSSPLSSPHPSRNRESKLRTALSASAKASKCSPRSKSHLTPSGVAAVKIANTQANGAAKSSTPSRSSRLSTPTNSATRPRRDRKSTVATTPAPDSVKQTPSATTQDAENLKSTTAKDNGSSRPQRSTSKRSNTVTLSLGRKSLESVVGSQPLDPISYDHGIVDSVEATPVHVYNDNFHFDYDTEMYKNNYGLDGQVDAPTSPTSFSTTTSTAARTSGRARKPTIRALESIESEKRFRRTRDTPVKVEPPKPEASSVISKAQPKPKPAHKPTTSAPQIIPRPDLGAIGKQLFELAAVAVADDYTPVSEAGDWWEEMRHEWKKQQAEKEKQDSQPVEEQSSPDGDGGGEGGARQTNEHGEEYVFVPLGFDWYRPNNTYGDDQLPLPPVRLRSQDQAEKDRVFGFPPRIGERNVPREIPGPFTFEDINQERAKIRAREAARVRGIVFDRSMPLGDIETLIIQYDNNAGLIPSTAPKEASSKPSKEPPSRKRRRTETTSSTPRATAPPESTPAPKRRRHEKTRTSTPATPNTVAETPATENLKSLRIKLTFSKGSVVAAAAAAAATNNEPVKSKKRPHSATEDPSSAGHSVRASKAQKLSGANGADTPTRQTPAPSTPRPIATTTEVKNENSNTSTIEQTPGETPGGRPRRRAAAALMAGFQQHADQRARRANARKKAATLSDKPEESPLKKVDPITMD